MKSFTVFLFIFFTFFAGAQDNLVTNPSFEDFTNPIIHRWNGSNHPAIPLVTGWFTATGGSADYYNDDESTMMGYAIANAHTGEGRAAFIGAAKRTQVRPEYSEYVEGKLISPLEANQWYCVKFYVALDRTSKSTIDSIGIYFSTTPVSVESYKPLKVIPQIVTPADSFITAQDGWVEISGLYQAKGGEEFITIGSFSTKPRVKLKSIGEKQASRTPFSMVKKFAYFYLDDVSVVKVDSTSMHQCTEENKKTVAHHSRYLFLVDVSGSMNAGGKLDSVKISLRDVINMLPPETEVSLVSFSNEPRRVLDFMPVNKKTEIFNAIDSLKPGGLTGVSRSIDFTYQYLESIEDINGASVILFTDGIFEVHPASANRIKKNFNERHIEFTTMQFGDKVNYDLQKIAAVTDGNYVQNANNDLEQKLGEEMYYEVPVAKTSPVKYGKAKAEFIALRPLKYWLFILIAAAAIHQYT